MILVHPRILVVSALCGGCALIAFALTDPSGNDVISTAITLKQANPILRGMAVRAMVLVIMRSKLFNFQESGVGGEVIYTLLRSLALQSVNNTRTQQRPKSLNANFDPAFAIPTYFSQLEATIAASMQTRSPELRQRAADEVRAVKANAPAPPMDKTNPVWDDFYRSMTGICFDYCGPAVLKGYPGFR
jgi:hypothetical protein